MLSAGAPASFCVVCLQCGAVVAAVAAAAGDAAPGDCTHVDEGGRLTLTVVPAAPHTATGGVVRGARGALAASQPWARTAASQTPIATTPLRMRAVGAAARDTPPGRDRNDRRDDRSVRRPEKDAHKESIIESTDATFELSCQTADDVPRRSSSDKSSSSSSGSTDDRGGGGGGGGGQGASTTVTTATCNDQSSVGIRESGGGGTNSAAQTVAAPALEAALTDAEKRAMLGGTYCSCCSNYGCVDPQHRPHHAPRADPGRTHDGDEIATSNRSRSRTPSGAATPDGLAGTWAFGAREGPQTPSGGGGSSGATYRGHSHRAWAGMNSSPRGQSPVVPSGGLTPVADSAATADDEVANCYCAVCHVLYNSAATRWEEHVRSDVHQAAVAFIRSREEASHAGGAGANALSPPQRFVIHRPPLPRELRSPSEAGNHHSFSRGVPPMTAAQHLHFGTPPDRNADDADHHNTAAAEGVHAEERHAAPSSTAAASTPPPSASAAPSAAALGHRAGPDDVPRTVHPDHHQRPPPTHRVQHDRSTSPLRPHAEDAESHRAYLRILCRTFIADREQRVRNALFLRWHRRMYRRRVLLSARWGAGGAGAAARDPQPAAAAAAAEGLHVSCAEDDDSDSGAAARRCDGGQLPDDNNDNDGIRRTVKAAVRDALREEGAAALRRLEVRCAEEEQIWRLARLRTEECTSARRPSPRGDSPMRWRLPPVRASVGKHSPPGSRCSTKELLARLSGATRSAVDTATAALLREQGKRERRRQRCRAAASRSPSCRACSRAAAAPLGEEPRRRQGKSTTQPAAAREAAGRAAAAAVEADPLAQLRAARRSERRQFMEEERQRRHREGQRRAASPTAPMTQRRPRSSSGGSHTIGSAANTVNAASLASCSTIRPGTARTAVSDPAPAATGRRRPASAAPATTTTTGGGNRCSACGRPPRGAPYATLAPAAAPAPFRPRPGCSVCSAEVVHALGQLPAAAAEGPPRIGPFARAEGESRGIRGARVECTPAAGLPPPPPAPQQSLQQQPQQQRCGWGAPHDDPDDPRAFGKPGMWFSRHRPHPAAAPPVNACDAALEEALERLAGFQRLQADHRVAAATSSCFMRQREAPLHTVGITINR